MKTLIYLSLITLCFNPSKIFAQTGNDCSDAIDLSTLSSPFEGTTTGYSNDFDQNCVFGAVDRIFYIDVLDGQTIVMQQTFNNYDSRNSVVYGNDCPGQNAIDCWDDPDYKSVLWTNNTGDTQRVWWIQDAYSSYGSGDFILSWGIVLPPDNDLCGDAIAIGCSQTITGSTISASPDPLTYCAGGLASTFGVWYEMQGNGNPVTLDLCNSDYDTQLGVFTGDCNNLICVALDDDGGCSLSSLIEFDSDLGTNYYVLVTGYNSNTGNYELTVDCEVSFTNDLAIMQLISPVDSCAYQQLQQVQVEIRNEGTVPQSGFQVGYTMNNGSLSTATFSGTIQPEESATFIFPQLVNLDIIDEYHFQLFTNLSNDQNNFNDTLYATVKHLPPLDINISAQYDYNTICQGDYLFLIVDYDYNYSYQYEWSTGDLGYYIYVTPTENTEYTVTVTDISQPSCMGVGTLVIEVVEPPEVPVFFASSNTICPGGNVTLTVQNITENLLWNTGETGNAIVVNQPGYYSVSHIGANGCSSTSQLVYIGLESVPYLYSSGDGIICGQETETLYISTVSGSSFEWSTGETTASIVVMPSVTTNYTVTVTTANNCVHILESIIAIASDLPPGSVADMLPLDGAQNIASPVQFSWSPAPNATTYNVFVWEENNTQPVFSSFYTSQINYTYYDFLQYGQTYNWMVCSENVCSEADTVCSIVQKFTLNYLPDLIAIVDNNSFPDTAFSGTEIAVSWEVYNNGVGSTQGVSTNGQWYDACYLSTDMTLSNDDISLGWAVNPTALFAGAGYNNSLSFQLPNAIEGAYFLIACADRYNYMPESDELNNCGVATMPIFIQLSPYPDLVVESFPPPAGAAGGVVFAGETYDIQWIVENQSNGINSAPTQSGEWYDRIYISTENIFNFQTASHLTTVIHQGNLATEETYTGSASIQIPSNAEDTIYLFICTDAFNVEYEYVFEDNNCLISLPLVVPVVPDPDFILESITAPDTASNRENISINWEGRNIAAAFSGSFSDRMYISENPDFSGWYSTLGSTANNISLLSNNETYTSEDNFQIPDYITGKYYLIARANGSNSVDEIDFSNNIIVDSIFIISPNLTVTEIVDIADVFSGQTITIEWKVANIGEGDLLSNYVSERIKLVDINNPDNTTTLATAGNTLTIFSGDTLTRQINYNIPPGFIGNYCIEVHTNYNQNTYENGQYADNTLINCDTFHIAAADYPNLKAMTVGSSITAATAGESVDITFSVQNNGDVPTADIWQDRIYFSTSNIWNANTAMFLKTESESQIILSGSFYEKTFTVPLSTNLAAGVYYFHLLTDYGNAVFETNEDDNITTSLNTISIAVYPEVDLQFIGTPAGPATLTPGQPATISYEVENNGTVITPGDIWFDALYLSPNPTWEPSDIPIAEWQRNGALDAGANYARQESFTLPSGFTDAFYLCLVIDHQNDVFETNENNNYVKVLQQNGDPVTIVYPPNPDLTIQNLTIPVNGIAGQPLSLDYTIKNISIEGDASGEWAELVYLSSDLTLGSGDILLGQKNHTGGLLANEEYDETMTITFPLGISGNYFILIKTDGANNVTEVNETNNTANELIFITQPAPGDLVVTPAEIQVPPIDTIATDINISWQLKNIGQNPVSGYMAQGVYLSQDNIWGPDDILLGSWTGNVGLDPNAAVVHSLTARLENVKRQDYYVFIKTDLLDHFLEDDETNNCSVGFSTVFVEIPELPIGLPATPAVAELEKPIYYRIEIPVDTIGETMRVRITSNDNTTFNELYISHNDIPGRTVHDYFFSTPFEENQEIIIPAIDSGTYYVMAYAVDGMPLQSVEFLAEIIPFQINAINANQGGNTGTMTALLEGAKFVSGMNVELEKTGLPTITASQVNVVNSTKAFVTFPLEGATIGLYDVIGSTPTDQDSLANGFEIITGTIGNEMIQADCSLNLGPGGVVVTNVPAGVDVLVFEPIHPSVVRPNQIVPITLRFENTGDVDVPVPSRIFSSINGFPLAEATDNLGENLQDLPLTFIEDDGPPNVLRPGGVAFITVYSKATQSEGVLKFKLLSN